MLSLMTDSFIPCTLISISCIIVLLLWIILFHLQASLVLSVSEHSQEVLSSAAKYQTLVYYGEALYEEGECHRAEVCRWRMSHSWGVYSVFLLESQLDANLDIYLAKSENEKSILSILKFIFKIIANYSGTDCACSCICLNG